MSPEVGVIFGELAGASPEERELYYSAHETPPELRREIESLLAFDTGTAIGSIVDTAAGVVFQEPVSAGDFCGPFRLIRLIGRGGMGIVYLAERVDGEVRQLVAVKLLRAAFDSTAARQRFLQERQILANLVHPNIGSLIDAGHRADGHPYLVMEYIEGQAINEHSRDLTVYQKVVLIATVCDAIAYAHQKLVVHRDLKPGNILVDGSGNPHVLDFGIAKLIDDADATSTMERRLTPDYASPEQLLGSLVTTAADIYSLGAVLYKLLTGEAPARKDPQPPIRTRRPADRDLNAIVMKAIRAEPHERYATADKLAEDLRAWLDRRPVAARQRERWYHARRQLRRHWVMAAAGGIAASGLIVGLVTARSERDLAQQRFAEVRQLANEFFALDKDIQALPGSAQVRERIVTTSIKYLEGLSKRAGQDWRLKAEIAAGYRKAAVAQGLFRGVNLGRPDDARESLSKAAALLTEVRAAAPDDRSVLHDFIELVELQTRLEFAAKNLKALEAKLQELQDLLGRYEPAAKDEPAEWQFLGDVYDSMSSSARELGRMDVPMRFARRTVELQRKAAERENSFSARGALARALSTYGNLLRATGDLNGAVETNQQSLAILEQMAAEKPDSYPALVNLANVHTALARSLGDANGPSLGQTDAAIKHYEESLRIGRRLMALDANERQIRQNHSLAAWRLADALRGRDPQSALARYDESIKIMRPMTGNRPYVDVLFVGVLSESTFALRAIGRESEIGSRIEEASRICEPYRTQAPSVFESCSEYLSRAVAGRALAKRCPLEAVTAHREWLSVAEREKELEHAKEDAYSAFVLTNRYRLLRDSLLAAGSPTEADQIEVKRRALVAVWKTKLSGRNDAERILR